MREQRGGELRLEFLMTATSVLTLFSQKGHLEVAFSASIAENRYGASQRRRPIGGWDQDQGKQQSENRHVPKADMSTSILHSYADQFKRG